MPRYQKLTHFHATPVSNETLCLPNTNIFPSLKLKVFKRHKSSYGYLPSSRINIYGLIKLRRKGRAASVPLHLTRPFLRSPKEFAPKLIRALSFNYLPLGIKK